VKISVCLCQASLLLLTGISLGGEFMLGYRLRPITDERDEVGYTGSARLYGAKRPKEKLGAEPEYKSAKPLYVTLKLGAADDNRYSCVLDESRGTGEGYDLAYVDTDNDEDLAEHRPIRALRTMGSIYFGPAKAVVKHGSFKSIHHFYFRTYDESTRVYAYSTCYFVGKAKFGDKTHKIAVVDANCNGLFNEYSRDRLLVDLDGDGEFTTGGDAGESSRLGKYARVGETYYTVSISSDGAVVEVAQPAISLGTVRLPCKNMSVELTSESAGYLGLRSTDGVVDAPVGTYEIGQITLKARDANGNEWQLTAYAPPKGAKPLTVLPDQEAVLIAGPPLTPRVVADVDGYIAELSLSLTGIAGERYRSFAMNDQRPPNPTFEICDAKGKRLLASNFEYG